MADRVICHFGLAKCFEYETSVTQGGSRVDGVAGLVAGGVAGELRFLMRANAVIDPDNESVDSRRRYLQNLEQ